MNRSTAAVVCTLLFGCGKAANVPFESGDRLRARVLDGGDGAVSFLGWFDTTLESECDFRMATDGRWRCLPTSEDARIGWTDSDILYEDAACTHPLRVLPTGVPVPAMVQGEPGDRTACDTDDRPVPAYSLGAERFGVGLLHYRWGDDCVSSSSDPATQRVFELGDVVDPVQFVGAEATVEAVDARIGATVLNAEDRSSRVVGLVDQERDAPCRTMWGGPPAPCFPLRMAWDIGYRGDAECEQPVAYTSNYVPGGMSGECDPLVVMGYGETCGTFVTYEVGELSEAVATEWSDGECLIHDDPADQHAYYEVGAPIPLDRWPTVVQIDVGAGRLQARQTGANGRALQGDLAFFDTQWDAVCSPTSFCDGTTRCLPNYTWAEHFSDSTCTTRIARVGSACGTPDDYALARVPNTEQDDCIGASDVLTVGELVTPDAVWVGYDQSCLPYADASDADLWRAVGVVVPTPEFAELVERTE